jgi:hypothetical protein
MDESSFRVSFKDLWVLGQSVPGGKRLPLARLDDKYRTHIHGELRIEVAGRVFPHLGYRGPDDVCFNEWARELSEAARILSGSDGATHVYDEGEQGQPAFRFQREGAQVFVSIIDSSLSDGQANPAWQRIPCRLTAFVAGVSSFLDELKAVVERDAPECMGKIWCATTGLAR